MPSRRGAGDAAPDQILGDRDEIVEGALALALQRGLVPFRAELAAAADIGDDIDAALLEPQLAERAGIGRGHRHLKPAIAVEQGRGMFSMNVTLLISFSVVMPNLTFIEGQLRAETACPPRGRRDGSQKSAF